MFTLFGALAFLQNDNGLEFVNTISLNFAQWGTLKVKV